MEVYGGKGDLTRVRVDGTEVTIGRHSSNGIVLAHGNVSKYHARLVQRDGTITVVDLKSTNGTYLNGRQLTAPTVMRTSDAVYIGDVRIYVRDDDDEELTGQWTLPAFIARDPIEHQLLMEIAASDDAARVVYADWLEARGELARAELLRVQQDIVGCGPDDPRFEALAARLRTLAGSTDIAWRARVARPAVEGCAVAFELSCPKEWGKMQPTADDSVRYCGSCKKHVHYAANAGEAREHAQRGDCVAIDVAGLRWNGDLEPPYGRYVCSRCELDVGPGPRNCPRCGTTVRPPVMMAGGMVPSRR